MLFHRHTLEKKCWVDFYYFPEFMLFVYFDPAVGYFLLLLHGNHYLYFLLYSFLYSPLLCARRQSSHVVRGLQTDLSQGLNSLLSWNSRKHRVQFRNLVVHQQFSSRYSPWHSPTVTQLAHVSYHFLDR